MPVSSASCPSASAASSLAWFSGIVEVVAGGEHGRAARGQVVGALAPLARQPAAGQRAPGDHAHAVLAAGGQHVGLDAAGEDRVGRLLADEALEAALAGDPLGLHDLRRRVGRGADVAHLALGHEVGQRAERLVVVGPRVPAVDLVEVDPVGLQALQRGLDLAHDPAPRVAGLVRVVAHRAVELGGEDDVVAPVVGGQRLADDLLGLAARVDVGGVDEVDARVERPVDDPDRSRRGRSRPRRRTSWRRGRGGSRGRRCCRGCAGSWRERYSCGVLGPRGR